MKRLLLGFTIALVAAVWMIGSWYFFNSITDGTGGLSTPACADRQGRIKDEKPRLNAIAGNIRNFVTQEIVC